MGWDEGIVGMLSVDYLEQSGNKKTDKLLLEMVKLWDGMRWVEWDGMGWDGYTIESRVVVVSFTLPTAEKCWTDADCGGI